MQGLKRAALSVLLIILAVAPVFGAPRWRGDARVHGLSGTLLGVWMDYSGSWKRAWVASDRDGVFYTPDACDTLNPVADGLFRTLRKAGIEPRLTQFGVHPRRFSTLYAFFNIGPQAPREGSLSAIARGEGRFWVSL